MLERVKTTTESVCLDEPNLTRILGSRTGVERNRIVVEYLHAKQSTQQSLSQIKNKWSYFRHSVQAYNAKGKQSFPLELEREVAEHLLAACEVNPNYIPLLAKGLF